MLRARRQIWQAALWVLYPLATSAQAVRGLVVDVNNTPVAGVVVQLIDGAVAIGTPTLSNERGEFRVVVARAGTYRLRTLRIGFRPMTSDPLDVLADNQNGARGPSKL